MQHLQPNTTLQGGKYRIERVLGQGGFGNTYVGVNTTFEDRVAIKEFFMQGINDRDDATGSVTVSLERNRPQFEEQLAKFKKEALRIRKLDNLHIVKVHDMFEENGTAYYVMDYIDGENLAERLKRTGRPMTESELRLILPQILEALKAVHNAGIWHLDLKPANIMLAKGGIIKLIDFGASKQLNTQNGGATTSTAISYTNGYAPREQMEQNYDKFGPWTDIYALGATFYNLLTNRRPPLPIDIDDDYTADKHIALPFPTDVSDGVKLFVLQLMSTNRKKRPQSIEELLSKMDMYSSKSGVRSPKPDEDKVLASVDSEATIIASTSSEKIFVEQKSMQEEKTGSKSASAIYFSRQPDKKSNNNLGKAIGTMLFLAVTIGVIGLIIGIKSCENEVQLPTESMIEWCDSGAIEVIDTLSEAEAVKAEAAKKAAEAAKRAAEKRSKPKNLQRIREGKDLRGKNPFKQ